MNSLPSGIQTAAPDLILCLSHLRWDLVWQRPHHLMSRAAGTHAVAYLEEPMPGGEPGPVLRERTDRSGVTILTPHIPEGADPEAETRALLRRWLARRPYGRLILWFYTPMALGIAAGVPADAWVYDCMDDLSAFDFAPAALPGLEAALLARADLVFAGGRSLHAARRDRRPDIGLFPSSVDAGHFRKARTVTEDPPDQAHLRRPRVGFFGVIDERMDLALVASTARQLPGIEFVMLGPVVKVDPARLPRAHNIHWLGPKPYGSLPDYLAHWDAGWMPFALNRATRFISPTKTPEFLAAGLPVASTAVPDVVADYGANGLVRIADAVTMPGTVVAALSDRSAEWTARVEAFLARSSWDATWAGMSACLDEALIARPPASRGPLREVERFA